MTTERILRLGIDPTPLEQGGRRGRAEMGRVGSAARDAEKDIEAVAEGFAMLGSAADGGTREAARAVQSLSSKTAEAQNLIDRALRSGTATSGDAAEANMLLRDSLAGVSDVLITMPGPIGKVGAGLGKIAIGGLLLGGATVAVSLLADAFQRQREKVAEAQRAQDALLKSTEIYASGSSRAASKILEQRDALKETADEVQRLIDLQAEINTKDPFFQAIDLLLQAVGAGADRSNLEQRQSDVADRQRGISDEGLVGDVFGELADLKKLNAVIGDLTGIGDLDDQVRLLIGRFSGLIADGIDPAGQAMQLLRSELERTIGTQEEARRLLEAQKDEEQRRLAVETLDNQLADARALNKALGGLTGGPIDGAGGIDSQIDILESGIAGLITLFGSASEEVQRAVLQLQILRLPRDRDPTIANPFALAPPTITTPIEAPALAAARALSKFELATLDAKQGLSRAHDNFKGGFDVGNLLEAAGGNLLAGAVGAVFGAVGGLFGESEAERASRQVLASNTEALDRLNRGIATLGAAIGSTPGGVFGTIRQALIGAGGGGTGFVEGFGPITTAPSDKVFRQLLREAGLSFADAADLANALGVTLDGSVQSLEKFREALDTDFLNQFFKSGPVELSQLRAELLDQSPERQLDELLRSLTTGLGDSALGQLLGQGGFDEFLKEFVAKITTGTFTEGDFGDLTPDQLLALTRAIEALQDNTDAVNESNRLLNQPRGFKIEPFRFNATVGEVRVPGPTDKNNPRDGDPFGPTGGGMGGGSTGSGGGIGDGSTQGGGELFITGDVHVHVSGKDESDIELARKVGRGLLALNTTGGVTDVYMAVQRPRQRTG